MPKLGTHNIVVKTGLEIKKLLQNSVNDMEKIMSEVDKRKVDFDLLHLCDRMQVELAKYKLKIREHT